MDLKNYPNQHWFKRYIHYNPHTGQFTRIQRASNGRPIGPMCSQKRAFKLQQEWYQFSVVAWIYMTGKRPDNAIRFKDGDTRNLKFDNLMLSSEPSYACKRHNKWMAYFYMPKSTKQYYAGMHNTEDEARAAAHAAMELLKAKQVEEGV